MGFSRKTALVLPVRLAGMVGYLQDKLPFCAEIVRLLWSLLMVVPGNSLNNDDLLKAKDFTYFLQKDI